MARSEQPAVLVELVQLAVLVVPFQRHRTSQLGAKIKTGRKYRAGISVALFLARLKNSNRI